MNKTKIILLLFVSVILFMAYGLSPKLKKDSYEQILVSFEVEDHGQINICNNFTVDFISDSKIYKSEIKDCTIIIPIFPKELKKVKVEFRYKNYVLKFDDIQIEWLTLNQKMNWNFRVDYPPFDELNNETLNKKNLKMIYYFQFNPLESGQAIEIINPIY